MENPDTSDTQPRRSKRFAGGTATATEGATSAEKSKATTKKNSTSKPLGSKATSKATLKATPKNSKAKASKPGKEDAKKTMDEDEPEEGLYQKEARNALMPLIDELQAILRAFEHSSEASAWYRGLNTRFELISRVANNIKVRKDLLDRIELQDAFVCPSSHELAEDVSHALLVTKYKDLEAHRHAVVRHGLDPVAPSTYCLHKHYLAYQLDDRTAVRVGRPQPFPLPLELLHPAFRTYTAWAVHRSTSSDDPDDDNVIQLDRCVRTLQQTMPKIFSNHDARQKAFLEALVEAFPEDPYYEWCPNEPADVLNSPGNQTKYKIDLVYRNRLTLVPLIFVEVKLEMGEGGDPFWQNNRLYQTYIELCPEALKNGAPVFFLHLCGNLTFIQLFPHSDCFSPGVHLGIGGAFCDAKDQPPIFQQLGGYVNLQYDYTGRSFDEGYYMIRALQHAIKLIPT
jgi:hypothetical protein